MSYRKQIEEIRAQIEGLKNTEEALIKEWVEKEHPLKIGDIVKVTCYAFTGQKMAVTHLHVSNKWEGWEWSATGNIIKKDGTPGLRNGEWSAPVKEESCA